MKFLPIQVGSAEEARAYVAAARCTTCIRKSFAGVSWIEQGERKTLRWEDV